MHCTDRGCQTGFARHHGIAAAPEVSLVVSLSAGLSERDSFLGEAYLVGDKIVSIMSPAPSAPAIGHALYALFFAGGG